MNELKVPEQFEGPWCHGFILTYGVDIPFFENALWGQFGAHCRNKIILADGQCYLEACAVYARGGQVRHMNQRYVAEGIFAPHAAHAKCILLANQERGRLLVGSGNLGWQGYASGGELFTQYEYSADEPLALNAFLTVRELIEDMVTHGYVGPLAASRIRHLLEETPWLLQSPAGDWQPVRHNLTYSFLSQLQQAVGDEPVEELWVLSPFYDQEAVALERLLATFNPRLATLLVQAGYSADPAALQRVLDCFGGRCRVCSFSRGSDNTYVHAKLYLLKLSNRAICLQGSPNLSQVAMLLTHPHGNIELANLLTGPRDAFDNLLDVQVQPEVASLDVLELSYQPPKPAIGPASDGWRLTGGEWHADRLHLYFQGTSPDLQDASLVINDRPFPLDIHRREHQGLEIRLLPDAASMLERPVPVVIHWGEGNDASTTNPVFVCNRAVLDDVLKLTDGDGVLPRVGDLNLDDEEFERLLGELDAALMIDRRSVWQLAGRALPPTVSDDDEALRLDYADVDYEMLRRHPKIQQYVGIRPDGRAYARSRLQIILNAITDHFRGLLNVSPGVQPTAAIDAALEEITAETEGECEREEEEKQQHRRTQAQRIRRILKSFLRRYLRGIRSPDFQELAGFEVMAQNYVIFVHILWRLFSKDWVEPEFVVDSLLQTWTFFWGGSSEAGLFRGLDEDQQALVRRLIQGDQHSDAVLMAALYYSARLTRIERWEECRFALRDFWRETLCRPPFEVTAEILEGTWRVVASVIPYEPPLPTAIVEELVHLAEFESPNSFLRALEERHHLPRGACEFKTQPVYREPLQRSDRIKCLVVSAGDGLPDAGVAVAMLREWMRFEDLDYYRIQDSASARLLYYEGLEQKGLYWTRDQGEQSIGSVVPASADWDATLSQIQSRAAQVDTRLTLPPKSEEACIEATAMVQGGSGQRNDQGDCGFYS